MTVFITGGCKNGKSTFALRLAAALAPGSPHWYVATLLPKDEEGRKCVRRHRAARADMNFVTLEEPFCPTACLDAHGESGVFLLDSVTALLTNALYEAEAPVPDPEEELAAFVRRAEHAVLVSDYIYCDGGDYNGESEAFRAKLAALDARLAGACDTVVEIVGGIPTVRKGGLPWT